MKHFKDIKNKLELEKYYDPDFDWNNLDFYHNNTLTEDFIRKFQDDVNWDCISSCQKLSEDFIREFKNKVNWTCISSCQKLSEDFIREFKDRVNWEYIIKYNELSKILLENLKII